MNHLRFVLAFLLGLTSSQSAISQQPPSPLVDSFETYQQMKRESVYGLEWVSIGPVVNSARVESVQLDPTTPGTIYVAFGSGNLWKTTNNGVTWRALFEDQASHGIGDIALAPSNPSVIYLGTGESLKKARNFTIPGTGVYRSDDGGENWRHLGLSDSWHIGEIAVHPQNPDIVLVAVLGHFWSRNPNRGLYRTEDGGKSWQHVLYIDEKTGGNDVVWAQENPDVVYASMWENYPGVCGKNSSVHRSNDGGITWKKCDNGIPAGDQIGRIGLAVSQTNSDKVYALVDNREFIQAGAAQVFKSLDGGASWIKSHETDLQFFSRIGWYFADIYVNPHDDQEIFALGVRLAHSSDGGKSFDYLGGQVSHVNPSPASGLHLDQCEMWINPTNPKHLVLGNDGGLYQSFDRGATWVHFNNLPTGEFYDIAIDQQTPYRIFAGAQDDATVYGPPDERDSRDADPWKYLWIDPWNGGDGCVTQIDPGDPNTVYFSAQEGAFLRKDMTTNRAVGIRPELPKGHAGKLEFNFVAPMIISPHDNNTLYLAGNYIFKSMNRGEDWQVISPDIAVSNDELRRSLAAGAIAESPLVPGLIYAGTDKGALWVSEDGGEQWSERSEQLPQGYVRSIVPSRYSDSRAYVAISGLNYDDFCSHLYCTEDRGVTWHSLSPNLPDEPANVILEDPFFENILYAGTFRGVFLSTDRGKSWSLLGKNLPACSIADLEIQELEKDMIVATHGRGIYKLNLAPLYEYCDDSSGFKPNGYLFPIPAAVRPYQSDTRPGLNFRGVNKATFTFWQQQAGKVTLSVLDVAEEPEETEDTEKSGDNKKIEPAKKPGLAGKTIATFSFPGEKGLNQFRWDLVIKTNESSAPYFIDYKEYLDTGTYRFRIETADGVILEREFDVVDDPGED